MGTWDIGPFDNDGAADWVLDFVESKQPAKFLQDSFVALEKSLADGGIEGEEESVAAAEVVATLIGKPGSGASPEIDAWLESKPDVKVTPALVDHAMRSMRSILEHPDCNMRGCWEEVAEGPQWRAGIENLIARLGGKA